MNKLGFALPAMLALVLTTILLAGERNPKASTSNPSPILVELFTSEGCSSCPPADALLQKFDTQPFPGAQLIVLSEHVDYWNHIGWTDPYSSAAYSDRQSRYGSHFHLDSVYTPQMVVDGQDEFVGNSASEAKKVFERATLIAKIPLRISGARLEGGVLRAHVYIDALSDHNPKADVFFVVALDHAESQVARGENAGRRLTHVAVVLNLVKVGHVEAGKAFSQDVSVQLQQKGGSQMLRVIAFVQAPGLGRILGATMQDLGK